MAMTSATSNIRAKAKALATSELDVSIKQFARAEAAKVARADAAALKAEERADRLEAIAIELTTAWEAHLVDLRAERSTRNAAWVARRLVLEARTLQVEEHLDAKMQNAKSRNGNLAAAAEPSPQWVNLPLQDAKAEMTQLRTEKQELLERLAALEKKAAPPTARLSDGIHAQCGQAVIFAENEVPVLKTNPDKDAKRMLSLLGSNLTAWGQAGQVPI